MIGGADAWLIIDEKALPKKGVCSAGVAPLYASSLRNTGNCRFMVWHMLASQEIPEMVGLRLFPPKSWTSDPQRVAQARVPENWWTARGKPEFSIEETERVIASGAHFVCMLYDSDYGSSRPFPSGSERTRFPVGGGDVTTLDRLPSRHEHYVSCRKGVKVSQISHRRTTA